MNTYHTLYLEELLSKGIRWIKGYRIPFISAMIAGLLAHCFAFSNKLPNYDDLNHLFGKGITIDLGRWGLDLTSYFFPDYSMPWIYGIISLLLFSLSACIIIHIFQIRSKLLQVLLAANIVAFPALTGTVLFLFTLAPYALAFLLSVIPAYLLQLGGKKRFIIANICMIFSLSIYQSYISIIASILVLMLIQQLLREEAFQSVLLKGIQYLSFLIISLGVYYLLTRVIQHLLQVDFNDYASERLSFSLANIPNGIIEAYRAFYHFFTSDLYSLAPTAFSRFIHILCCLASAGLLVIWFFSLEKKDWAKICLLLLLLLLFPIAINAMYLFVNANSRSIYTRVLYSYIALYLFAAVIIESCCLSMHHSKKMSVFSHLSSNLLVAGLAVVVCINIYIANATYMALYFRYENTYSLFTNLISDLKQQPEFSKDTPVAICGWFPDAFFYWDEFPFVYSIDGSNGIPSNMIQPFSQIYLGIRNEPTYATAEQIESVVNTEEYAQMPCYPYYGSTKMINDILVVKLSND